MPVTFSRGGDVFDVYQGNGTFRVNHNGMDILDYRVGDAAPGDPAPVDPDPVDPEPVDPAPAPTPAPNPPPAQPAPTGWRAAVEALRTKVFYSGPNKIPAASYVQAGQTMRFENFSYDAVPGVRLVRPIDVAGTVTRIGDFEFRGPFGQGTDADQMSSVIYQRPNASLTAAGAVELIENGRFEGWPADILKLAGVSGKVQTLRNIHFAGQFARAVTGAHCDTITIPLQIGDILIEDCLFDRVVVGGPTIYFNNFLRIVPNNGTNPVGVHRVTLRRVVVEAEKYLSALIHIQHTANFKPFVDFEDVFLPASRLDANQLLYPGSKIGRWVNVRDTYTGDPLPAPPGALTV